MKKGFTLIELLIVITIIGILAVVFLPTIMSAPQKSRDAARQANLSQITQAFAAASLDASTDLPGDDICSTDLADGLKKYFSGVLPSDPYDLNVGPGPEETCLGSYYIDQAPAGGTAKYKVYARMELKANQAIKCPADTAPVAPALGDCSAVEIY